jgi:peptide deformylase
MPERVRLVSDSVLRTPCDPVNFLEDHTFIVGLLEAMNETMVASNGVGLAANQIGVSVKVFILKNETSFNEFINPEILSQSDLVPFEGEACLSIPGALATTKRYSTLKLKWFDRFGIEKQETFTGFRAFAVQHEMDHLNGKLYIDQLGPVKRSLVLSKHQKFLKGY